MWLIGAQFRFTFALVVALASAAALADDASAQRGRALIGRVGGAFAYEGHSP